MQLGNTMTTKMVVTRYRDGSGRIGGRECGVVQKATDGDDDDDGDDGDATVELETPQSGRTLRPESETRSKAAVDSGFLRWKLVSSICDRRSFFYFIHFGIALIH